MGQCFYYGNGVGQNYGQAQLWYERAAEGKLLWLLRLI